jgi:uncharacterized phage-associated protein
MTVSVFSAAKWLARRSGWTKSNLELQKILYLAHMFFLGRTDGTPLVNGHFEAWEYGPVHPELYREIRIFGSEPVKNVFHGVPDLEEGMERAILDEAHEALGSVRASQLVHATHRKDGAWYRNYVPGQRHCIIPNSDILDEYRQLDAVAPAAV